MPQSIPAGRRQGLRSLAKMCETLILEALIARKLWKADAVHTLLAADDEPETKAGKRGSK